ncbi:pyridine nucleotide-disulfide oxidoreductase, partial [Peribacillus sp. NPDC096447]
MSKQIVILGAGYAGLLSALSVREYYKRDEVQVTVVNQFPTH